MDIKNITDDTSNVKKQIVISVILSFVFIITFSVFIINMFIEKKKEELISQSELIGNLIYEIKLFDLMHASDEFGDNTDGATLSQVQKAFTNLSSKLKETEFLVAQKSKTHIDFIAFSQQKPKSVLLHKKDIAVPMRLALKGETGLILASDYDGDPVYAAYRPIDEKWGLVVKQDKYLYLRQIYILTFVFITLSVIVMYVMIRVISRRQKDLSYRNKKLVDTVNSLTSAAKQANLIAQGDYNIDIEVKGENDILGIALRNMTQILRENKIETSKQVWISDALVGLNKEMSGKLDVYEVSKKSIDYLCSYLNAGIGAVYIYEGKRLKLYGSYAFVEREELSSEFQFGEGTVGQVAQQRSPILLKNIRRSQVTITTGTTSEAPINTYTFPLIYQNDLQGVIEIGSHEFFDEAAFELLESANTIIAASCATARQNKKVEKLLQVAQETNLQMEEQQAQLEEANAHMEEQQHQLEQSKEILLEKNRDIEKKAKEIEAKVKELEVSSKYRSEFLANMSHELRTPLNAIILLTSLMQKNRNKNLTDEDIKKITTVHDSGNELLKLINDILDLSKIEAGKMNLVIEEFQSSDFIAQQERLFEATAQEKGIDFFVIDEYRGAISSDPDRVGQIIRNLLSNAFKFTKEGSVTLKIGYRENHKHPIEVSVSDTGIGIPKAKQELIFQAFTQADGTTSREFGGTGLGLSISKELSTLLGGYISLTSKENEGSEFVVHLPNLPLQNKHHKNKNRIKQVSTKASIDDRMSLSLKDEAFLIIDDDENFAKTLYEEIKTAGASALIAHDGKSALELAKKHVLKGILLDLTLPDIDGIELLKKFKQDRELKYIPVHIISSKDKDMKGLKLGAVGYTQKPLHGDDVETILNTLKSTNENVVKNLLIVEDDKVHLDALVELVGEGVHTESTDSAEDAIELIKKENFNAIVVDLGLTRGNGYEVCEFVKASHPNIPIIVYTGQDLTQADKANLRRLSDAIVLKTAYSDERILSEIELFLHKNLHEEKKIDQQNEPARLDGLHILAVDDDIKNIYVLTTALDDYGAKVSAAYDGKEALEFLKQDRSVDIVLMDIMMPVMDGYEAMEKIRLDEELKNIPVIALTAKAMKEDRKKCLDAGADDYVSKPLNLEALSALIKAWSEKRAR